MRILWATPWNSESAIARVSAMVVDELQKKGVSVCVVRTEDLSLIESKGLPVTPLARFPFQIRPMEEFDATVINFGDNWPFHAKALQFLTATPCIAVLHDATLFHFYTGKPHFSGKSGALEQFCNEASAIYGPHPCSSKNLNLEDAAWAMLASKQWPFMHEIALQADAVVVHSDHCIESIPESCWGKAHKMMLPAFPAPWKQPARPFLDGGEVRLCTIGHMNENKRMASVIQSIAASPELKKRAIYTLAGPIEDGKRDALQALAADVGFQGLRILGRVTDREMSECLNAAHIVCCLRHPAIEGGSASVLEALQYGRPTLVSLGGFYRQIPDECVWKVDPNREIPGIIEHLDEICSNYTQALEKAALAPAWVTSNCTSVRYAEQIMEIIARILPLKAVSLTNEHLQSITTSFGVSAHDPLRLKLLAVSESLFGVVGDRSKKKDSSVL